MLEVPDNNSLKLILYGSLCVILVPFCHYARIRVQRNIITLINADLSYLQQHASNLRFLFCFVNFRQSVTKYYENFKKCFKSPLSPYTSLRTDNVAWQKFCSLFLNIAKRGKGRETQNCPNSSFSHNFCY